MYCPKCSRQLTTEKARFCSRCGFNLDIVKALLAADGLASTSVPTSHSGINLGVILMMLGTLFTSGVTAAGDLRLPGAFLILVATYISILLSSRPMMQAIRKLGSFEEPPAAHIPERQKEISFGATFMFIGTILSACAATTAPGPMGDVTFFAVLLMVFSALLFSSRRLMLAARDLLSSNKDRQIGSSQMFLTISDELSHSTGAMIQPPSVIEDTTGLLEAKSGDNSPHSKRSATLSWRI